MNKKIIYETDAIDLLKKWADGYKYIEIETELAIKEFEQLPSVQSRKKGKWIVTNKFEDCYYAKCNECKVTQVFYYNKALTNYCPNCGANMRGK